MSTEITVLVIVVAVIFVMGFAVFFGAPYVPTRQAWAREALKLADIKKSDTVVDLGSGDGVILKLVAERGARAVGYEINPILYLLSRIRTAKYVPKITVNLRNYWSEKLPTNTTVVYAFCVDRDAEKLEKYLTGQDIKGLKVITFGFSLPNKKPVKTSNGASLYII